jgi:pyridoxine kinase
MNSDLIPRVAAVHDLCGYGNCSLGIALPVLTACGIDAIPAATAVLSTHTAFDKYTFYDLTDSLEATFLHWQEMGFRIDGIYSGFLGSARQIDILRRFFEKSADRLILVDPVMADHGRIYKTYTPEMCAGLSQLARHADILTPNMTEAAVLLNEPYRGQTADAAESRRLCEGLMTLGCRQVVLKGIERGDGLVYNAILNEQGDYTECQNPKVDAALHGTGDLFASVVAGLVFRKKSLVDAVRFAGQFVYDAILLSKSQPGYLERGVSFEPLIGRIAAYAAE